MRKILLFSLALFSISSFAHAQADSGFSCRGVISSLTLDVDMFFDKTNSLKSIVVSPTKWRVSEEVRFSGQEIYMKQVNVGSEQLPFLNVTFNGYKNINNVVNVRFPEQGEGEITAFVKAKIQQFDIASEGKESEFRCIEF